MIDGMLEDLCGKDLFTGLIETLQINLFDPAGTFNSVLTLVKSMYSSIIQPIALMLMVIYFLLALVDKMTSENFTWEQMGRQMCMFLASFYLINHGFEILELLFGLGLRLTEDVGSKVGTGFGDMEALKEQFEFFKNDNKPAIKFLEDIILFLYLLLPWLLSWIMGIAVKIICYTRIIEIYARATFAPIALSDFFHSGFQGAGWRFLKGFLAVCMQGALILAIAGFFSKLFPLVMNTGEEWGSFFRFIGMYLALMASAVMLMFKSLGICKELLGVG